MMDTKLTIETLTKMIENKWVALRIGDINPAEDCSNPMLHSAINECTDWEGEQTEEELIEKVLEHLDERGYSSILQKDYDREVRETIEAGDDFLELRLEKGYVYASTTLVESIDDLYELFKIAESERAVGLDEGEKVYITIEDFEIFDVNFDPGSVVKSNVDWIDITEIIEKLKEEEECEN